MNMPRIYTDPSQSKTTVAIVSDMDMLEEKLINMPDVKTDEEAEMVSEYRAQFNGKAKLLDKERLEMTTGARDTVKMLNDKYNVIIERSKRMVQLADNKLLPFMRKREEERREADRKRHEQEEAERKAAREAQDAIDEANRVANETQDAEALQEAEAVVEEARAGLDALKKTPVARATERSVQGSLGSKTSVIKVWKYRLTDINKVPEDYLVPPEERLHKGALNAVAKRDQDMAVVPGIEFYHEDRLASRSGVKS